MRGKRRDYLLDQRYHRDHKRNIVQNGREDSAAAEDSNGQKDEVISRDTDKPLLSVTCVKQGFQHDRR